MSSDSRGRYTEVSVECTTPFLIEKSSLGQLSSCFLPLTGIQYWCTALSVLVDHFVDVVLCSCRLSTASWGLFCSFSLFFSRYTGPALAYVTVPLVNTWYHNTAILHLLV